VNLSSWLSPPVLWGLAAAVPAVLAEYLYKTLQGPWIKWLPLWIVLQLSIGYCIYKLVTTPNTTLMESFTVWAFSTIAMRVAVSIFILGETVKGGTWAALALIVMARVIQATWGR
jgi:multidrug transporter EmrE-like cation transporter